MTTATGMGPLPDLVEAMAGTAGLARVFRRSGLPLELATERSLRIPLSAMVDLFAEAARETGERAFGLQVGWRMRPGAYGIWMEYSLAAPTLRAAIARLAWGIPLHQTGPRVELIMRDGTGIWSYVVPRVGAADPRAHADHVAPTMIEIARGYIGRDWLPAWIGVGYANDGHAGTLADLMKAPWRFDSRGVSLPIATADLDRPRSSPPNGARMLTRADVLAERMLHSSSLAAAVEGCIAVGLLDGGTDVETVSRRLDLSTRRLQRGLLAEGSSFSALLDRFRHRKALELLSRPEVSITEVALSLGYTDPANFTRAYRRWTGHAPSATRSHEG